MAVIDELRALAPKIQWAELDRGRIAAVVDDMEIVDPWLSECGRFEVDPRDAYGMSLEVASKLLEHNKAIERG